MLWSGSPFVGVPDSRPVLVSGYRLLSTRSLAVLSTADAAATATVAALDHER